jgi:hypothetical protein
MQLFSILWLKTNTVMTEALDEYMHSSRRGAFPRVATDATILRTIWDSSRAVGRRSAGNVVDVRSDQLVWQTFPAAIGTTLRQQVTIASDFVRFLQKSYPDYCIKIWPYLQFSSYRHVGYVDSSVVPLDRNTVPIPDAYIDRTDQIVYSQIAYRLVWAKVVHPIKPNE